MTAIGIIGDVPPWSSRAAALGKQLPIHYAYQLQGASAFVHAQGQHVESPLTPLATLEQLAGKSDALILTVPEAMPGDALVYGELAASALSFRKPLHIERAFALGHNAIRQLYEQARHCGTPLHMSSPLRYAPAYMEADRMGIETIVSLGPGKQLSCTLAQIEPILLMMGTEARRIMAYGTPAYPAWLIEFTGARQATIYLCGQGAEYQLTVNHRSGRNVMLKPGDGYEAEFFRQLLQFLETGKAVAASEEAITALALHDFSLKAVKKPYQWLELTLDGH